MTTAEHRAFGALLKRYRHAAGLTQEGLAERGLQVGRGGCSRRGSQEPYAPLLGALEQYLRQRDPIHLCADLHGCAWLVRLLPELAEGPVEPLPAWSLTPDQERRLMFRAL